MNGTRYSHTISLILTFCSFSPSVPGSWQGLRLMFIWKACWPNSSPDDPVVRWCLLLVTLAVIVLLHCSVCNLLLWFSKHVLSKETNTGDPASLYLLCTLLFCFYSSSFYPLNVIFSHFTFCIPIEGQVGPSVTFQSKMSRGQSFHASYHWDPQFLLCLTFHRQALGRVWCPLITDCGLGK